MGSSVVPRQALPDELKNDTRDVSDLWKDALKSYKGIVGFDLQQKFDSVETMISFGTQEMDNFHKFRHNDKKVDKLRSLFATNIDLLEQGAQQLISAATPAFPPAAAIGTAITYLLTACRQVSADYDIVVVFFDDMNSFLQRIVILETRLPSYKAYQNCLMDVFTSFLTMCGFAHKYIELGRFKKWIQNLLNGEDSDLGTARKGMDQKLSRLQNATEFAILGNTEELQKMSIELKKNQASHTAMLQAQMEAMESIRDATDSIKGDMTKLLKAFEDQKRQALKSQKPKSSSEQNKPPSAKRIRNTLPEFEGEIHEYHILKETMVEGMCQWVFSEPQWTQWLTEEVGRVPLLAITGSQGTGKSHIAATIHDEIWRRSREDAHGSTCVAHFYFREQNQTLSSFLAFVVTLVNQVVEQNPAVCEKINVEYLKDEVDIDVWEWKELLSKLLAPAFSKTSKNSLIIIMDGIDELPSIEPLIDFVKMSHKLELKFKLALTSRPESVTQSLRDLVQVSDIEITAEKQKEDLKALVWSRLNTLPSLRQFSRYVKQRIAAKSEEVAPNLLYAEHLMDRIDAMGREGAVLRRLDQSLPPDLPTLYRDLLETCMRRTPEKYQDYVMLLLQWVAVAAQPLSLAEVTSLLRFLTKDPNFDIDEIPEPFSKFLQIGDPGSDAEERAKIQAQGGWGTAIQDVDKSHDGGSSDRVYQDGPLPVKFRQRAMRHYFREAPMTPDDAPWPSSKVHRRIFLIAADIARPSSLRDVKVVVDDKLVWHCTLFLFYHWYRIEPDQHSAEENVEVTEVFREIMVNEYRFATMMEWIGGSYGRHIDSDFFKKVQSWAERFSRPGNTYPGLSDLSLQWWQSLADQPQSCMTGLVRGHIGKLYSAPDLARALKSFKAARQALLTGTLDDALLEQAKSNFPDINFEHVGEGNQAPDKDAVLGIIDGFTDISMTATAYRAVAELLFHFKHRSFAETACKKALALCDDSLERFKASHLLSRVHLRSRKAPLALEAIDRCLEDVESADISPKLKRQAFLTKARIESKLKKVQEASSSYAKAREMDPDTLISGDALEEELGLYAKGEDKSAYITLLKKWSPLERLTWLAWKYDDLSDDRHALLRDMLVQTGESKFGVDIYEEAIRFLDKINAGAPLRCDLAALFMQVCQDYEAARKTLDEVFDSDSSGWPWAITNEFPDCTLERALNLQSDVLYQLFSASSDPLAKQELLNTARGLMTRRLPLDVPPQSDTGLLHPRIVIARMELKLGPVLGFQRSLQGVIDSCVSALTDKVGWNDSLCLIILVRALGVLSQVVPNKDEIIRLAEIFSSARFSKLSSDSGGHADAGEVDGDESEEEGDAESGDEDDDEDKDDDDEDDDDGDDDDDDDDDDGSENDDEDEEKESPPADELGLDSPDNICWGCDGACDPVNWFNWWGDRVGYQCITCWDGFLCEECHDARQAANKEEKPLRVRQYCGRDHVYIKAPVKGWKGLEDGKILIDGEEGMDFNELLLKTRDVICKDSWDSFWKG